MRFLHLPDLFAKRNDGGEKAVAKDGLEQDAQDEVQAVRVVGDRSVAWWG